MKLEFATFLLDKSYSEIGEKAQTWRESFDFRLRRRLHGCRYCPFSSAMEGRTLSDSALWHQCFFIRRKPFSPSGPSGSQWIEIVALRRRRLSSARNEHLPTQRSARSRGEFSLDIHQSSD